MGGDYPVEGGEQPAAPSCGVKISCTDELEKRDVTKRRRLLHEPSFPASRDAIAGRK
jgi:hypothetical protein